MAVVAYRAGLLYCICSGQREEPEEEGGDAERGGKGKSFNLHTDDGKEDYTKNLSEKKCVLCNLKKARLKQ